jgi:hypothetical protein
VAPSDIRGRHCSLTFPSLPLHVHDQRLWQSAVSESWGDQPAVSGAAFVDAELSTTRSLEGLLKPIIDGLTPCVGRDPRAPLEFAPNITSSFGCRSVARSDQPSGPGSA